MRYARNFLFRSTHEDWYICQSEKRKTFGTEVILDYYNGEPDVLDRCTFLLNPILNNELRHCKNAIGPVKAPEINGQQFPHPPDLVQHTPAPPIVLPSCIPFCPPGKTEAASRSASGTGTSAVAIPSTSSTSTSSKSKFKLRFGHTKKKLPLATEDNDHTGAERSCEIRKLR